MKSCLKFDLCTWDWDHGYQETFSQICPGFKCLLSGVRLKKSEPALANKSCWTDFLLASCGLVLWHHDVCRDAHIEPGYKTGSNQQQGNHWFPQLLWFLCLNWVGLEYHIAIAFHYTANKNKEEKSGCGRICLLDVTVKSLSLSSASPTKWQEAEKYMKR